jgi:tripartite-type tricarboxylate transporter receptor subunit TctC
MTRRPLLHALAAGLALAGPFSAAWAQPSDWPSKPVRIIVAFPPGAPGDVVARLVGEKLAAKWKQPVVVENRPGAGGNIGMDAVAKSAPDGYTLLVGPDTMYTVNPHIYRSMPVKPDTDLVPVTHLAAFTQMLVCHPGAGVSSVPELVKMAKGQTLSYASGGAGVPGHLAFEMLSDAAGIRMTHIPYRGPSPATQDVLGGQVPCGFLATPVVYPHVRSGKLKALAVSSATRSPLAKEVPTVAESGYPGFDASFAETLAAPRGTPAALVQRIQADVAAALQDPALRQQLQANDLDPLGITPEEAARRHAQGHAKWGQVAAKVGLKLD